MLQRTPISPNVNNSNFNNGNLHQYDPYIIEDDHILIDIQWWSTLDLRIQYMINNHLDGKYKLGTVIIPHEIQNDNEYKMLKIVYQSYIDGFDYNLWYNKNISELPQNVSMIHIHQNVKTILADIYKQKKKCDDEELLEFNRPGG